MQIEIDELRELANEAEEIAEELDRLKEENETYKKEVANEISKEKNLRSTLDTDSLKIRKEVEELRKNIIRL